MVSWILLIVGGLNWLLFAFGYGLDNWLPMGVMRGIYVLIGLSALLELFTHKENCKVCTSSAPASM